MKVTLTDKLSTPIKSSRVYDDNGFLRVPAKAARTGIQQYLASELGLKDRNPMELVNVYRPPEEVFAADSLKSYKDVDVTIEHPEDMVSCETYDAVSVGHVTSDGRQEGDWVVCDLIIKSKDAIKEIESGKVEISMGYEMDLKAMDGFTDFGESYEFVQTSLKMNHAALVSSARAGHEARIFDNKPKVQQMKITLTDGKTVAVDSEEKAMLIQSAFDSLQKRLKDAEEKAEDMEEEKEKAEVAKDMAEAEKEKMEDELEKEKEKTTDSAISALVARVAKTMDSAKKIAGKDFTCDSMNEIAIKRAALSDAYPKKNWQDLSDAVIAFAFDESEEKKAEAEGEDEKEKSYDSWSRLAKDAQSVKVTDQQKTMDAAYDAGMKAKQAAFRGGNK